MDKFKIEVKWAIIFSLFMLLWMCIERLLGWHDVHIDKHPIYTNLVAIPSILLYVLALKEKRNHFYQGKMTWVQGFISGLIITSIVAIFSPIAQLITHKIISPHFFQNAINYGVEHKLTTLEEAQKNFNLKNYILMSFFGALVMGFITSALVALFAQKK
ncbi:MAG: DUF4199 domain-containing protein [Chitinophagaceae bacterium]